MNPLSGHLTEDDVLVGTLAPSTSLCGNVSAEQTIVGAIHESTQILTGSITTNVRPSYYEISNEAGTTVIIGV